MRGLNAAANGEFSDLAGFSALHSVFDKIVTMDELMMSNSL